MIFTHWALLGEDGVDVLGEALCLWAGLVHGEGVGAESHVVRVLGEDPVGFSRVDGLGGIPACDALAS